MQNFKNGVK